MAKQLIRQFYSMEENDEKSIEVLSQLRSCYYARCYLWDRLKCSTMISVATSQSGKNWETWEPPKWRMVKLRLEWGYAPNWFVTNDTFNFGSEALQFDFTFVEGGYQATANYKQKLYPTTVGAPMI